MARKELLAVGRPKKYKTKASLERAVRAYFDGITYTHPALDEAGKEIRRDGEIVLAESYTEPPTLAGLCLHLGIDKKTWSKYSDPKQHPEFEDVTAWAKLKCEAYLVSLLSQPWLKNSKGIQFNLENNYGWRQKTEVELGEETRNAMPLAGMSMEEKLQLIAEAQAAAAAVDADGEGD